MNQIHSRTKIVFYGFLSFTFFFFYWGLLPKFADIKPSFYTAGLTMFALCVTEVFAYNLSKITK